MIEVIEAPNDGTFWRTQKSLFLAGGITGCWNWQQELIDTISHLDLVVYNPRRANFPIDDPSAAAEQIRWEYKYLHLVDAVSFWFPQETLCPITLFELGACLDRMPDKLFIGTHPKYARRQDVIIQAELHGYRYPVHKWIDDLAEEIEIWVKG